MTLHEATNVAWLAGLLEGEGCFDLKGRSPRIQLRMTDKDVMDRAATLTGGKVNGPYDQKGGTKSIYQMQLLRKELVRPVLEAILPFMGERRADKIEQLLTAYS